MELGISVSERVVRRRSAELGRSVSYRVVQVKAGRSGVKTEAEVNAGRHFS